MPLRELANTLKSLGAPVVYVHDASPGSDYLSVPDVAREIATSEDTIRSWINSGLLRASNIATGKRPRYLIQRADLVAFLEGRKQQPKATRRKKTSIKRHYT